MTLSTASVAMPPALGRRARFLGVSQRLERPGEPFVPLVRPGEEDAGEHVGFAFPVAAVVGQHDVPDTVGRESADFGDAAVAGRPAEHVQQSADRFGCSDALVAAVAVARLDVRDLVREHGLQRRLRLQRAHQPGGHEDAAPCYRERIDHRVVDERELVAVALQRRGPLRQQPLAELLQLGLQRPIRHDAVLGARLCKRRALQLLLDLPLGDLRLRVETDHAAAVVVRLGLGEGAVPDALVGGHLVFRAAGVQHVGQRVGEVALELPLRGLGLEDLVHPDAELRHRRLVPVEADPPFAAIPRLDVDLDVVGLGIGILHAHLNRLRHGEELVALVDRMDAGPARRQDLHAAVFPRRRPQGERIVAVLVTLDVALDLLPAFSLGVPRGSARDALQAVEESLPSRRRCRGQ